MAGESVAQFVAELRRTASHYEFGEYLTEALRDRLVCGLRSEPAQRKLLGEGGALTLERAIEIAMMMESAKEQAQSLHGSSELVVGLVDKRRLEPSAASKTCHRCGKPVSSEYRHPVNMGTPDAHIHVNIGTRMPVFT